MDELLSNFGRSIKSARQAAGLTQEDLAIQSEVTSRYIIAIENESKYPTVYAAQTAINMTRTVVQAVAK